MDRFATPRPTFNVCEPFMGVYVIQLNVEMKDMLLDVLDRYGELEKELYAFKRSLQNPTASRELRAIKKRREIQDSHDDEWPERTLP